MSNLRFFAKQDEFHNEKAYVKKVQVQTLFTSNEI